jgi:dUTP pyrophosphatase
MRVAQLRLYIEDPTLKQLYIPHVAAHNESMMNDPFPNAGFDIFVPTRTAFNIPFETVMINMGIKCEMAYGGPSAFLLLPRSTISKTPLMLANHTGIIDCGYRGNICGAFRAFTPYAVVGETRLLQICHPSLTPIMVEIVDELTDTKRGELGFGSTGI